MRVIDRIATAWAPYAVTFSHDGTRLAIGGGSWYGLGGIALIDLRTREQQSLLLGDLEVEAFRNQPLTASVAETAGTRHQGGSVSCLAFTSDDRHLIASTWTSSHRTGPAFAFQVDQLSIRPVAWQRLPPLALSGIHAYGPGAVVRAWNTAADDTLDVIQWPASVPIDRSRGRPELTNHRLVVTHGCAVTGNHGANNGPAPAGRLLPGLIVRALGTGAMSYVHSGEASITAINATTDDSLITGTALGGLHAWTWHDGRPHHERSIGDIATPPREGRFAIYQPSAVVGICTMTDGRCVAVTAGGTLATWLPGEAITSWPLPVPGTPRTIAGSPDRAMVAIGIKLGGFANPSGAIALVEIEPDTVADPQRIPRTREIAAAVDQQRAANGTFDPAMLAVLADALEEAGCRPRVLHHLRTHDHRLRTCWVLDELRE